MLRYALLSVIHVQRRRGGVARFADAQRSPGDQADTGRRRARSKGKLLEVSEARRIVYAVINLAVSLQIMIAEALDIERETYFAILMDRKWK